MSKLRLEGSSEARRKEQTKPVLQRIFSSLAGVPVSAAEPLYDSQGQRTDMAVAVVQTRLAALEVWSWSAAAASVKLGCKHK